VSFFLSFPTNFPFFVPRIRLVSIPFRLFYFSLFVLFGFVISFDFALLRLVTVRRHTQTNTHTHTHTHTNAYNNTYSNSFLLHTEKTGAYIAPIENVLLPVYRRRGLV
jgi:hypothetical protein